MRQLLTIHNPTTKQLVGVVRSTERYLRSCSTQ